MRHILFRGKKVSDGEWIYGYYLVNEAIDEHKIHYYDCDGLIPGMRTTIVDSKTVGQFIGISDKNNIKIFEDDILNRYAEESAPNGYKKGQLMYEGPVFYSDKSCACLLSSGIHFNLHNKMDLEIIGNIHDNPNFREEIECQKKHTL